MNCQQFQKFVSAFADGELDVEHNLEALEHLNMCQTCAGRVADIQQLKAALKRITPEEPAPARLRDRILAALSAEAASPRNEADVEIYVDDDEAEDAIVLRPTARRRAGHLVPLAMAAAVLFSVTVWQLVPLMSAHEGRITLRAETVRDVREQHMRCTAHTDRPHHDPTLGTSLQEVASRLSRRLGMRVLAPDLTEFGFTFVGADQCGIRNRTGAHILYECADFDTMFSLFTVAPIPDEDAARRRRVGDRSYFQACKEGTRVVAWRDGDATYVGCGGDELPETLLLNVAEAARKADIP